MIGNAEEVRLLVSSDIQAPERDVRVTVFVPTFNQVRYIAAALNSILAQEVAFSYRILVQDDASTDGTREIVQDYSARFPDRIQARLHAENQFSQGRRIIALGWPHFRGDYVAFLDGDDLWTDRTKLARQVAFMDARPGCALCQTMTSYWDETVGQEIQEFPPPHLRTNLPGEYLANGNFVQTSAALLRLAALPALPEDFDSIPFGDYAAFALASREGWIGFIPDKMSLYRIQSSNLWFNVDHQTRVARTEEVRSYLMARMPSLRRLYWVCAQEGRPLPRHLEFLRNFRRRLIKLGELSRPG